MSSLSVHQCIKLLHNNLEIEPELMYCAIKELISGSTSDILISSFLTAFHPDKLNSNLIRVAIKALREEAIPIPFNQNVMDMVGTGGDGLNTFNVTTASSIIVSASGQTFIKHGSRSSSSKCGAADILEAAGCKLNLTPEQSLKILNQTNYCFIFGPIYHPAWKYVSTIRKELGIRTIFNVVGPLISPLNCIGYRIIGVYNYKFGKIFAEVLIDLGVKRAAIIHAHDGMDEISCYEKTHIWFVDNNQIDEFDLSPEDFGLPRHDLSSIRGSTPDQNYETLLRIFNGENLAQTDFVLMNSAFALVVCEKAKNWKEGIQLAKDIIQSGKAKQLLEKYSKLSQTISDNPVIYPLIPSINNSHPPYVKICGIRDIESALCVANNGGDMLGLIFAANSKRKITLEQAKLIVTEVHSCQHRPLIVGVFANQTVEEINDIVKKVEIDYIQLHGNEGFDIVTKLIKPVIRSIPVIPNETTAEQILNILNQEKQAGWRIAAVLLDTKLPQSNNNDGGTGQTFDWSIAATIGLEYPIILAGGLNPDNVQSAVRIANPWAVDVASGVEKDKNSVEKDHEKIRQFIANVKLSH
ncbi:unnamed protein product [Adineta steineri]|uniref:Phosphoribosylanthranilate isomerase n=1 Tax=Adineta steineri TaxID=433720 RepID=A0A819TG88_9BILA|nr:unnamed protein product [Adineta steineri]